MNLVKELENHGQSVWLDFLARGFIVKGELKKLIDTDGVKGVTSNPSIFEKAIGHGDDYDALIAGLMPMTDPTTAVAISQRKIISAAASMPVSTRSGSPPSKP